MIPFSLVLASLARRRNDKRLGLKKAHIDGLYSDVLQSTSSAANLVNMWGSVNVLAVTES
jgi:hypothetical protein